MGMTNFEFFAIVVFVMAVLGSLAWKQIKRAGEKFEEDCWKERETFRVAADKVSQDAEETRKVNLDLYNEACSMEPFCGAGDAHTRSREAVARAQAAARASMKLAALSKGVESSLLDGMVERCLPAAKETLFYGLRADEMSRDQLLVMAFKGWQLLLEARTPVDLVAFHKE